MAAEPLPSNQNNHESYNNENDEWRKFLIALLFLLFSFGCVFCSSQTALLVINRDRIEASMRSESRADYGPDPAIALAPLDEKIVAEAAQDEAMLALRQTPISQGLAVAVLPNPLPTPSATLIAILPTATPTPTPTPVPPEVISSPPPTLIVPSTATVAPPPASPPATVVPPLPTDILPSPTSAPTPLPPTVPPPTVPPPTSPPPTSPPPTSPPPPTSVPERLFFTAANYRVTEGAGGATITVVLNHASLRTITVNYASSNVSAVAGQDYVATSGVLIFAPGQLSQSFQVPIIDDNLTNEPDEQLRLTLSNPINAELGTPNPATLTIEDNDGQPAVRFSAAGYTAAEGDGSATITVQLSAPSAVAVTVAYNSADITATAGRDYTAVNSVLTIPAEQLTATFAVPIIDDNLANEPNENVELTLSSPTNAMLGTPASATLTIIDNDPLPEVRFSSDTFSVGEGDGQATITVELSAPSAVAVTVVYISVDGTATAGADYTAVSDVLTIPPEQLSAVFVVPILEDILANEGNEDLELALSNPINAALGAPNPATLIITDNDPLPEVRFSSDAYSVGEGDGQATITVELSAPSAVDVTVEYAATDGTATAGSDYIEVSGTLTIPAEQLSATFDVTILDDNLANEGAETVALTLSNPISATLGTPNPATLTITDNDPLPEVQFEQSDFNVAEDGGPAVITVNLTAPSAVTVTVDYASNNVTAIAGADYEAVIDTLTFPPTQTSQTFTVTIFDDSLPEAEESLTLTLSNPTANAVLGATNPAILTINDDDRPPNNNCNPLYPSGEPNLGPPDGEFARLACDVGIIIDLGTSPISVTDPADTDYELIYFEARGISDTGVPLTPPDMIFLDLVTIEIAEDPAGPWYPVFIWGDNIADTNTNLMRSSPTYPDTGEASDNAIIQTPPLVGPPGQEFGVAIDVDNSPTGGPIPAGNYRYIRLFSPLAGENDGPEIDALEVLP